MSLFVIAPNEVRCDSCDQAEPIPTGPIDVATFQMILGGLVAKHAACRRYRLTSKAYESAFAAVKGEQP